MIRASKLVTIVLTGLLLALVAACAPIQAPVSSIQPTSAPAATQAPAAQNTQAPSAQATEVPAAAATQPAASGNVKTLTIAMSQEPKGFGVMFAQVAAIEVEQALNAYWTYRDADLNPQPWL